MQKVPEIYIYEMEEMNATIPWLEEEFAKGFHAVRRSGRHWSGLWSDLVIGQTLVRSIKSRRDLTRGRGMRETVRPLWILILSHSAAVNHAMSSLSGVAIKYSGHHIVMGSSRRSGDFGDACKYIEWLKKRNHLTYADTLSLMPVSELDGVNCEDAEAIGKAIHESLDGLSLPAAKIKHRDRIKPLDSFYTTVTVD